jgi:hypothetical protein
MIDEVGGEQFVQRVHVSPGYRFPKAANQGLVLLLLRRHWSFLLVAYARLSNKSTPTMMPRGGVRHIGLHQERPWSPTRVTFSLAKLGGE